MKIVVAEKISSSAMDLLREPRWTVVTPDQIDGKLAAHLESADALIVRSAVQVDAASARARPQTARDRARRRGRGQHRPRRRHPQGHRRDEHARRQCRRRGGTDPGHDAGHGASPLPRQRVDARRQVGEEISARHRTARQDAGHRRPGQDRHGSRPPGARPSAWRSSRTIPSSPPPWPKSRAFAWPRWTKSMQPPTTSPCTSA